MKEADDNPEPGGTSGLAAKQEKAILALLNHATIAKAAEQCGASEWTIRRWLREDPAFQGAYRAARREAFDQAIGLTQRYAGSAVQTLVKAMADPNSPHATRVNAAIAVLRFGREGTVIDDLTQRVEVLEGSLADGGGGAGKKTGSLEHLTDSELMHTMHESARLSRELEADAAKPKGQKP